MFRGSSNILTALFRKVVFSLLYNRKIKAFYIKNELMCLPCLTTGHDFLHSWRHLFGLHRSKLTIAIRVNLSWVAFCFNILIYVVIGPSSKTVKQPTSFQRKAMWREIYSIHLKYFMLRWILTESVQGFKEGAMGCHGGQLPWRAKQKFSMTPHR